MSTLRTRPRRWERLETRPGPTDPGLAPPIDARGVRVESHAGFGRPVVVGVDGSDASLRAVKVAVRLLGDSGDLILICATRRRRTIRTRRRRIHRDLPRGRPPGRR